ncbi:MAG: hypothetical protein NT170_02855 [Candidatus Moranbacteria bacterium]|nr:hypothetical protein [Candidatus Moranbacteria bacterium]
MTLETPGLEKGPESENSTMEKHGNVISRMKTALNRYFSSLGIAMFTVQAAMTLLELEFPEYANQLSKADCFTAIQALGFGILAGRIIADADAEESK